MTQPARSAARRASDSSREPLAEVPADEPAIEAVQVPVAGLALAGPQTVHRMPHAPRDVLGALRRRASCCDQPHGQPEPADRLTLRRSAVIRRAPQPSATLGEFVDPDAPGFVFLPTGRANEYRIKGSEIVVTWEAESGHWVGADGLVVQFQPQPTAGPTPALDLSGGLPLPKTSKIPANLGENYFSMEHFKHLGVYDQMMALAELVNKFPITPYELLAGADGRDERPMKFYRYHKFPIGFDDPQYVLGGGLNKVEITEEWQAKTLKKLISDRRKLLASITLNDPGKLVKAMERFQANAMSTPFIATTSDRGYAESLYRDYPPGDGQRAVLLVIEGPRGRTFNFEEMYQTVQGAGGGRAEWNWRTSANRAKDADQAEFGLPDLFIPLRGVSPLGFRIVEIVEMSMPPPDLWDELSVDQRMQVLQARRPPRVPALMAPSHAASSKPPDSDGDEV
ncbi:MAG TPA: hypothetical protein VFU36_15710 [Jatrophihabitans sp.]|nr:hypothetical protein [Jatrophihabitans sp.]